MIHLDYRDARPIYTQIIDGFKAQIKAGILCGGEKMPSVRELAAELTINPNTIQRAYRELEAMGFIVSVPGKGSFVSEMPTAPSHTPAWDALDQAVRQLVALGISKEEILQYLRQGGDQNA